MQIALQYEMIDEYDNPRSDWAQKEHSEPGSILPEGWKPSKEKRRIEQLEEFRKGMEEIRKRDAAPKSAPKREFAVRETWQDLAKLKDPAMTPAQAALMMNVTEEEARVKLEEAWDQIEDDKQQSLADKINKKPKAIAADSGDVDYGSLSIPELKTLAKSRSITITKAMKKPDIIAVLEGYDKLQEA